MNWSTIAKINLLALFDLYLIGIFVLGILLRYHQYRTIIRFVREVPDRWPNLYAVVKEERALFLNRATLVPIFGALAIMVIHTALYRFIWSSATISIEQLQKQWLLLTWTAICGLVMIFFDLRVLFSLRSYELKPIEEKLEQAEFWLSSWVSSAVKVVTLGLVKPTKKVRGELRKAISDSIKSMDRILYQWMIQIGLRFLFGFSLWTAWSVLGKAV